MRLTPAFSKADGLQRREQRRRRHAAAQTLQDVFPQVAHLRIQLTFADAACRLAPQSHGLHPPSKAFFEFPCPYADCDGHFDLSDLVAAALEAGQNQANGCIVCAGTRPQARLGKQPCHLSLECEVQVEYLANSQGRPPAD